MFLLLKFPSYHLVDFFFFNYLTQKTVTIFCSKANQLRLLINLWFYLLVLVPSDMFILVLTGQLGICLFLVFADIDDLYSKMDVSIVPRWIFFLLPIPL